MNISRRNFVYHSFSLAAGYLLFVKINTAIDRKVVTVKGLLDANQLGFSLIHEHILVDFIGADKIDRNRYNADEVFNKALPVLLSAKEKGCKTIMECTPAYLGRNVELLKRLSEESGLNILTNTGYYGAAQEKYLPAHAYTESAEQLASRWINEWKEGIDSSGIKPGFIKSGVDKYPLSAVQQKIIEAAAITHLSTGLTIGIHTGDGKAAMEEMRIITSKAVSPSAWIWIHAQNESDRSFHIQIAKAGGWVSFDGVNKNSIVECLAFLKDMKEQNLLHKILLSHDSGWYHVGEPNGGNYNDYNTISDILIPAMKEKGFTEKDIRQLFVVNPADAFAVRVRRK